MEALVDGGVDVIFIETIFDTLNAKAGVFAYEKYFKRTGKQKLPLFVRNYKQRFLEQSWMQVGALFRAKLLKLSTFH